MANIAQPSIFINYISERKKILVTDGNSPITQLFKVYQNCQTDYYFKIINHNNQTVSLNGREFKLYGSWTDAKRVDHIVFFTDSFQIENNVLHFRINTNTDDYIQYITNPDGTVGYVTIIETTYNRPQVVLYQKSLFYPRSGTEDDQKDYIVYRDILTGVNVPLTGSFGAGTNISLFPGANSFAFGEGLVTNIQNQFVVGQYNVIDAEQAFIVADGTTSGGYNLFTVNYDGEAYVGGNRILTVVDRTNVSELANDIGYITIADVPVYSAGEGLSLSNNTFSLTATIPSAVSQLTNDWGYVTEIALNATLADYAYISAVPTSTSQLVNNSDFATTGWVQSQGYLSSVPNTYALKSQIPTNNNQLTNGAGYITGYNAGSGITIENGTINCTVEGGGATYTAGSGISIDSNNVISLTATIPTVPTNVGAFNNDVGYLNCLSAYSYQNDQIITGNTLYFYPNDLLNCQTAGNGDISVVWRGLKHNGGTEDIQDAIAEAITWDSEDFTVNEGDGYVEVSLANSIPLSTSQLVNDSDFITSSALTGITPSKLKNIVVDNTVRSSYQKLQYNPSADLIVNTIKVNNGTDEILILNPVSGFENDIPVGKAVQFDQWVKVFGRFNKVQLGAGLINAGSPLLDENYYTQNYFASQGNIQNYTRSIVRLDANTTLQTIKYNGWFVGNPHASDPLTFKSTGTTAIKLVLNGSYESTPDFRYSFDTSQGWMWYDDTNPQWIVLNDGDELCFANATDYFSHSSSDYYQFETSGAGSLEIYGNIRSMNNYSQWTMKDYMFYKMFAGCEQITNATYLSIPTYSQIGSETYIYASMFSGCINLVYGPSELPRPRYLSPYACDSMFYGCSSLIVAPPVVGKNEYGSAGLFNNMFYGCSSLSSITAEFTEWGDCIGWVDGVAANGTFIKNSDLSDSRGSNAIPAGWTIVNV